MKRGELITVRVLPLFETEIQEEEKILIPGEIQSINLGNVVEQIYGNL